ncbi:hypothetical protein QE152_g15610 [Popillia japonica]|uniref:Uncharacterized protein n=1 Tax=Popillia japonica TaxID=7064 RepID=A0AAW1L7F6_POPJA
MMGWLSRNDWRCLNGWAKDDLCGEYTYVGARGSSVIDYVVVSDNIWESIDEFKVGDMTGSDHFPLECVFEGVTVKRYTSARKEVSCWSERGIQRHRENLGKVRFGEVVSIEQLMECVWKAVCKKERRDGAKPGWFDAECMIAKSGLREAVSRFRLSQIDKVQLLDEQGRYERTVDRKKNEWEEREIEKIRGIKVESEVWDLVKRVKGPRKNGAVGITMSEITMSEWEKYFRELLDGVNVEGNQVRGREVNVRPDEDGVSIELVREVESEAWMWATDECIRVLAGFLDEIWRGTREWPESWKYGVIVPVYKKGSREDVKSYRGVSDEYML